MSNYVYVKPHPEVRMLEYNGKKRMVLQTRERKAESHILSRHGYEINSVTLEILTQFDGTTTYDEIIQYFVDKYPETYESVDEKIKKVFKSLESTSGFKIFTQDKPVHRKITIHTNDYMYPMVASVELTEKCNMKCKHCYGSFGDHKSIEMQKDKLPDLFNSLAEVGIMSVELTGGDPSVYEYTSDAIDAAFEAGILSVVLLTNGAHLEDRLIEAILKYKKHMFVQIDLHSLNEEYFNWFTGSVGYLPKVKENILKLIGYGVGVRVCSIFTPRNAHEILDIAKWAYEHNAIEYAPSLIVEVGRASNVYSNHNLFFEDTDRLLNFDAKLGKLYESYPENFIRKTKSDATGNKPNCGALITSCSIKADGTIKMCAQDTADYLNCNLGNAFSRPLKDLYDDNRSFLRDFGKLIMPNENMEECKECKNRHFCANCVLRALLKATEVKGGCAWYNSNNITDEVRRKFPVSA